MLVRKSICCKTFQGGSWGGGGDHICISICIYIGPRAPQRLAGGDPAVPWSKRVKLQGAWVADLLEYTFWYRV